VLLGITSKVTVHNLVVTLLLSLLLLALSKLAKSQDNNGF